MDKVGCGRAAAGHVAARMTAGNGDARRKAFCPCRSLPEVLFVGHKRREAAVRQPPSGISYYSLIRMLNLACILDAFFASFQGL